MPQDGQYWKRRLGNLSDVEPYYHHLDLRRMDDLDDIGFAYLIGPVKGVNMLDLNETQITNESIKLLPGLEYVKELRAKECAVDNGCMADLNKIKGLELLHVKSTGITIDGLLQLTALTNLKTLLFSAGNIIAIKEKMMELKRMHPGCEFIVDGKDYPFDNIERFLYASKALPYAYRLKIKNKEEVVSWSKWMIKPTDSYYETEQQGPYAMREIEWISVKSLHEKEDANDQLIELLENSGVTYMPFDGEVRMYIV